LKTLTLLAPDYALLDSIWRNALPFVLWPVGSQSLLAHWMDEAVRTGMDQVTIHAADRPSEIRQHIEGGNYWSKKVTVLPLKNDADAPPEAIRMDRLPMQQAAALTLDSPVSLLKHWQGLQEAWLNNRAADTVSIDEERMPGGWVGPLARVHPQAVLTPPFWIGGRAEIGAGSRIGPHAFIGAGSVVDRSVQVENAVVMPDTYLGQNTRLSNAIAQGGVLVDIQRACRVDIRENFIMAPVTAHRQTASISERIGAFLVWVFLAPVAALWPGQKWKSTLTIDNKGEISTIRTGCAGPLVVRRWPWLKEIFLGNMRWFGILPRAESDWEHLPAETAERLKSSPRGFFSLADLYGCHDPASPDEWIHAAYQVLQNDETARKLLGKKILHLATLNPGSESTNPLQGS
jgi:hypothetical protein